MVFSITPQNIRKPHKMVKHTQTIRRQIADELFECVWPFYEVFLFSGGIEKDQWHEMAWYIQTLQFWSESANE